MRIQISWKGYDPSDAEKEEVAEKFSSLDLLLGHVNEDQKEADVRIEKRSRWGFEVRFDMQLLAEHIFAKSANESLVQACVSVREEVEKQVKRYLVK